MQPGTLRDPFDVAGRNLFGVRGFFVTCEPAKFAELLEKHAMDTLII